MEMKSKLGKMNSWIGFAKKFLGVSALVVSVLQCGQGMVVASDPVFDLVDDAPRSEYNSTYSTSTTGTNSFGSTGSAPGGATGTTTWGSTGTSTVGATGSPPGNALQY
jgi:hypothetical protein